MIDQYGTVYEKFKGNIWISKSEFNRNESRGINIAIIRKDNLLRVLAYEVITKETDLDELIWKVLKSQGWYDEVCHEYLNN